MRSASSIDVEEFIQDLEDGISSSADADIEENIKNSRDLYGNGIQLPNSCTQQSALDLNTIQPSVSVREIILENENIQEPANLQTQNMSRTQNQDQQVSTRKQIFLDTTKKLLLRPSAFSICLIILALVILVNVHLLNTDKNNIFTEMYIIVKRGYIFFLPVFLVMSEDSIVQFAKEKLRQQFRRNDF